jgi:hypothetical protein
VTAVSVLDLTVDGGTSGLASETPPFLADLNLDQIIASVIAGKEEYDLAPFFFRALHSVDEVEYRQAVMRDIEEAATHGAVSAFAERMRAVRGRLAQIETLYYRHQKEAWLLDAVADYCEAVEALRSKLVAARPKSVAFARLIGFLDNCLDASDFREMRDEAGALRAKLAAIRYFLVISGGVITVTEFRDEADYGAEIEADFAKFKRGDAGEYAFKFNESSRMNHIEAAILDRVALMNPDVFAALGAFAAKCHDFVDPTVRRFDREIQFYVSYLAHMRRIADGDLAFCYPEVSQASKETVMRDAFDLALAGAAREKQLHVVANDATLDGRERIIIVSGPNQGGKTTFARMFGQLHYLAALGLPTPGRMAKLFLFDQIFTHFEREETIANLRGKLHDDLSRLHESLTAATPRSVFILNEAFNATSLSDAIFLNTQILERIIALDAICVCVTFIDELASLSPTTVAMASTVKPDNPAERTFKVVRRPLDGLAYAVAVAEKRRLTYAQLRERLRT